ncbi:MAG TPA: hypothetical protein VF660_09050, partial [Actinomycetota bacterium]
MSRAASPTTFWFDERSPLLIVAVGGAIVLSVLTLGAAGPFPFPPSLSGGLVFFVAGASAATAAWWTARRRGAWRGTRWAAVATAAVSLVEAAGQIARRLSGGPTDADVASAGMLAVLIVFLGILVTDFYDHAREDRVALLSDVALVAVLTGSAAFLFLRLPGETVQSAWHVAMSLALIGMGVLVFSGWIVLSLWCPSPVHISLTACGALAAVAAVAFQHGQFLSRSADSLVGQRSAAAVSLLAMAAILAVEPRLNPGEPRTPKVAWWIRPALLAASLSAVSVLVVLSVLHPGSTLLGEGRLVLVSVVFAAVALRSLANQYELARTTKVLERTVQERGTAIASLRSASE